MVLKLGFVPLLDAMPLIAAHHLGYFTDEGLHVELERQIGWGNVRDKLVHGHLQASHALFGMPPLSALHDERYIEPLISIMALGTGGDAITLSRKLTDIGVDSAAALHRRLSQRTLRPPILAHVFGCSVHHYLLRDWLAASGVDPDRDLSLIVLPPMQTTMQMSTGVVDGFCVGEPWNTLAEANGFGKVIVTTTQILPAHPDKVLAVSRRWLSEHGEIAVALIRAVLRGCDYCDKPANRSAIAQMLAHPQCLNMPVDLLTRCLSPDRWSIGPRHEPVRSCAMTSTFPSMTHAQWLLGEMVRWKHLPADTDMHRAAQAAIDTAAYRRAAADFKLDCPTDDAPAMRLGKTKHIGDAHARVHV